MGLILQNVVSCGLNPQIGLTENFSHGFLIDLEMMFIKNQKLLWF